MLTIVPLFYLLEIQACFSPPIEVGVISQLIFIVKWAVKNGIKEAYRDITGKVTTEDIEAEQICNELGLNEEEK